MFADEMMNYVWGTAAELGEIASLKEHEQRGAIRCSA